MIRNSKKGIGLLLLVFNQTMVKLILWNVLKNKEKYTNGIIKVNSKIMKENNSFG